MMKFRDTDGVGIRRTRPTLPGHRYRLELQENIVSESAKSGVWVKQVDDVMLEITRNAALCKVRLLDPGVIEAVLHDNPSVCGTSNPRAFKKLRELLMMGFVMKDKLVDRLGPVETDALVSSIREKLVQRFGDKLGGAGAGG